LAARSPQAIGLADASASDGDAADDRHSPVEPLERLDMGGTAS
jgi:hypothetical protein